MERGFYHASRGYWQTISEPDEETLASYPEGTVEVPLKPGADHEWNGSEWVHLPPDTSATLAAWRATATITKVQLVRALRLLQPDGTLAEAGDTTAWATFGPLIEAHKDWPYITVIPRTDAPACDMATAIGATPEQMDAIWQLGGTL